MAGSYNKAIVIGNLGRDPETRTFGNGGRVCNLRVASSETWTDRESGLRRERTDWHNVAIFSEAVISGIVPHLRKSSRVLVDGRMETRKWQDQAGNDRYVTEVVIRPYQGILQMLDGSSQASQGQDQSTRDMGAGADHDHGYADDFAQR